MPDELSDEEATPINCGVATMCAVIEAAQISLGDTVIIQGLGLLGLYGAALAKARGASKVIGIDGVASRRDLALRFGVDVAVDPENREKNKLVEFAAQADAVIEVCGDLAVIPAGMELLRIGGRYVLAGLVSPDAMVTIDANRIVRNYLTLTGIHNYHPRHLIQALEFIRCYRQRYPFHDLVDGKYPLSEIDTAMADAASRRVLRAAIVP